MRLDIRDIKGVKTGDITLDDAVFASSINEHLLWETVKWQLAKRRSGTAMTKRRGEVWGTKKKPFKQKGTGRARAGNARSPIWVGGATTFGPRPRDYEYAMPKKARKQALRAALSLRVKENRMIVLDQFPVAEGKTRNVITALEALGAGDKVLIVDDKDNQLLTRGARNLATHKWLAPEGLNVYDVLDHDTLLITAASAKAVEQALRDK